MGFHAAAFRVSQIKSRALFMVQLSTSSSRSFSRKPQLSNHRKRPSFGIAFDIDGVILRGRLPIGGSPQALRRLYGDSASRNLEVPFLFLTNGGGIPESRRAIELTELLNVEIRPAQLLPFPD
ncbi:uncharacterized protein YKR070W-like, partial [Carica papaya]|uniref:uncharacterized protein YKR070W-like n=1 Tax=Carica papaya TaxID=3649 RepID=UPI000B8C87B3